MIYIQDKADRGRTPIGKGSDIMARRKKIYEGKAKTIYEGPEPALSSSISRMTPPPSTLRRRR